MAENKKSFVAYCDWLHTFEALPDEQAGKLAKHIWRYVNDLNPETDDIVINAVFAGMKLTLKRDLKKYEERVVRNRENGAKGGRPPKEPEKPNGLNSNQLGLSGTVEKQKKKRTVFTPPTIEEVSEYCLERKNGIDPQKWWDSYQSKGWMIGKSKMKDWKAAVRTWENNTENEKVKPAYNSKSKLPNNEAATREIINRAYNG